ncbi:type II toxin-antitoxin system PemK/MazF family toxin [Aurantimonas marianensis]|uniref:Type II toxin-antitoxin system PemK/MazF family toxin n=1 Tax=Aurantimonas marianensis TaxID=2920428 RepID=A0A9X2KG73_9HYPH|nr:type II toxin-antitoxin system PemK/MazF family toxin [Aurantimonas marianensis]MCP3055975.1 type II toxin-antitoxin system PemK/MazF family toxin [Aurantimonas marianensis]
MKRGDVVLVSGKGDYGKSRPAIVVQADYLAEHLGSVTVVPFTSDLSNDISIRFLVEPHPSNGLRERSQAMVDKIQTYPREKVFGPIGTLEPEQMMQIERALITFLQLASSLLAGPSTIPSISQGATP